MVKSSCSVIVLEDFHHSSPRECMERMFKGVDDDYTFPNEEPSDDIIFVEEDEEYLEKRDKYEIYLGPDTLEDKDEVDHHLPLDIVDLTTSDIDDRSSWEDFDEIQDNEAVIKERNLQREGKHKIEEEES